MTLPTQFPNESGEDFARRALRQSIIDGANDPPLKQFRAVQGEMMEATDEQLANAVAIGVKIGIQELLKDETALQAFWLTGYRNLTQQATDNASQWIGKRILIAAATLALGWLILYLAKNGGGHT